MPRILITTDPDCPVVTFEDFVEANAEHPDLVDAVQALAVGDVLTEGGGAAPFVLIRQIDDDAPAETAYAMWTTWVVDLAEERIADLRRFASEQDSLHAVQRARRSLLRHLRDLRTCLAQHVAEGGHRAGPASAARARLGALVASVEAHHVA